MTFIVTSDAAITRITAPRLPAAPTEYESRYQNQFADTLRLYFNQLDNTLRQFGVSSIVPAVTNFTVATLPSAVTSGAGSRAFVTDALTPSFGATVAGGGAVLTPVYSDGTDWKVG
jgi:hypothetical protein